MSMERLRYQDIPQNPDISEVAWLLDEAASDVIRYGNLEGIDRAAVSVNAFLFADKAQLAKPVLPYSLKRTIDTSLEEVKLQIPLGRSTDGMSLTFTFKKYDALEPLLSTIIREGEPVSSSETNNANHEGAGKFKLIYANGNAHIGTHTGLMRDELSQSRLCQPPYYRMKVALEHAPVADGRREVDEKETELVNGIWGAFKGGIVVATELPRP